MGTDMARADMQNRPKHVVQVPAFWIDKYPVTNAQYARFVAATSHRPPLHWKNGKIPEGTLLRPVTMVSWHDASAYAKWAGKRLPTEAEWEKAARGDSGFIFPWGNNFVTTNLNFCDKNCSQSWAMLEADDEYAYTAPVTAFPWGQSSYGLYNMSGNVAEWVDDWYQSYP